MTPGSGVVPKSAGGIETARTGLRSKKEAALGGGGQNLAGGPESEAHENGAAAYATKNIAWTHGTQRRMVSAHHPAWLLWTGERHARHHQYLTASDMEKIKRVLASARATTVSLGINDEAARFLMRKYQEGVIDEAAMAEALDQYVAKRNGWRLVPGCGARKAPAVKGPSRIVRRA